MLDSHASLNYVRYASMIGVSVIGCALPVVFFFLVRVRGLFVFLFFLSCPFFFFFSLSLSHSLSLVFPQHQRSIRTEGIHSLPAHVFAYKMLGREFF